jgi:hypothetical protein
MTVPDLLDMQGAQQTMTTSKTAGTTTSSRSITELGDKISTASSKVANLYLDGYETSINTAVSLQRKVANQSKIEKVQTVLDAQADLVSGIGKATVSASRKILS